MTIRLFSGGRRFYLPEALKIAATKHGDLNLEGPNRPH